MTNKPIFCLTVDKVGKFFLKNTFCLVTFVFVFLLLINAIRADELIMKAHYTCTAAVLEVSPLFAWHPIPHTLALGPFGKYAHLSKIASGYFLF